MNYLDKMKFWSIQKVGKLTVAARLGSSADYLEAQTIIEREGARVERWAIYRFSVLTL